MSPQPMKERTSLRELARRLGVNDKAVRKGIASRRLSGSVGHDADGRPFIADVDLAITEWKQNAGRLSARALNGQARTDDSPQSAGQSAAAATGSNVIPELTLVEAQRLATMQRERKLRIENDIAEGRLIPIELATKEAFEAERIIREGVLNLPARIAGELAAETDAGRVYLRLEAAIREALNMTADELLATVNA